MYLSRRACATPSPFTRLPFENDLATDELFQSSAHREAEARLKHLVELRGIGPTRSVGAHPARSDPARPPSAGTSPPASTPDCTASTTSP